MTDTTHDTGGLEAAARAQAAKSAPEPSGLSADTLPMQPGEEYVLKSDYLTARDELDSMRNDLQRVAADFENFKRRSAREREQASAAAETRLLRELLDVIDDAERAIEHSEKGETEKSSVVEGLKTIHSRLTGVASMHGLERIDASKGITFDPNLHEAMMVQAAPDGEPDDVIILELESGWKISDRVLRHARVIVTGGG